MTNRQRVIDAINKRIEVGIISRNLKSEIEYYLDTFADTDDYDAADALNDALNLAEGNRDRAVVRECINILIAVGFYRPRREGAVTAGRDRSPVRDGVKYDCVDAWSNWIDGGDA